jgi:hypothetical protein
MSTGEKALLGAAAVGTATVVAHALADDHEDAPPPPTAEDTSEENATGELAAATVVGAAAAALMAEDQAADDAAPAPAMDADTDENADAAAVAAVTAHDTDEDSHELADAGGAVDTKPSANQPQPPVTEEVHGVVARPGYIVSELSPGEFAALQTTQKARAAARKAWEQARAVTDYLRNV